MTTFAMEAIPRTTRAQAMDALSSQANLAGYAATLLAARESGQLLPDDDHRRRHRRPGQGHGPRRRRRRPAGDRHRQAAGRDRHRLRHPPRRLGADRLARRPARWSSTSSPTPRARAATPARSPTRRTSRSATRSTETAAKQDVIITTAQIPGRAAPAADHRRGRARDAARLGDRRPRRRDSGGNASRPRPGETVDVDGVKVIGPRQPGQRDGGADASQLYAKNLENLLGLLVTEEGELKVDFEDDIVDAACIAHEGEITRTRGRPSNELDDRDHDLRARRLRRLRGDLEGADDAAHAADVADQRDPRDRHARRADRRSATPTTGSST